MIVHTHTPGKEIMVLPSSVRRPASWLTGSWKGEVPGNWQPIASPTPTPTTIWKFGWPKQVSRPSLTLPSVMFPSKWRRLQGLQARKPSSLKTTLVATLLATRMWLDICIRCWKIMRATFSHKDGHVILRITSKSRSRRPVRAALITFQIWAPSKKEIWFWQGCVDHWTLSKPCCTGNVGAVIILKKDRQWFKDVVTPAWHWSFFSDLVILNFWIEEVCRQGVLPTIGDEGPVICWYHQRGQCMFGSTCKNKHEVSSPHHHEP